MVPIAIITTDERGLYPIGIIIFSVLFQLISLMLMLFLMSILRSSVVTRGCTLFITRNNCHKWGISREVDREKK